MKENYYKLWFTYNE